MDAVEEARQIIRERIAALEAERERLTDALAQLEPRKSKSATTPKRPATQAERAKPGERREQLLASIRRDPEAKVAEHPARDRRLAPAALPDPQAPRRRGADREDSRWVSSRRGADRLGIVTHERPPARSDRETVDLFFQRVERLDWGSALELAADDLTIISITGGVYRRSSGFADLIVEQFGSVTALAIAERTVHELGDGFLAYEMTYRATFFNGDQVAVPGVWLAHLERGTIGSIHFFRTLSDARAAVPPPR